MTLNGLTIKSVVAVFSALTILSNAAEKLTIPTYESSGQAIHPDVVYFNDAWNGYQYWMIMTPYPSANDAYENPSIVVSGDGVNWAVPNGLTNPIEPQPSAGFHNNDPELFYDSASNQLWAYWLTTSSSTLYLYFKASSDGVTWSDKEQILSLPYNQMVSPSIIKVGSVYYLYYVNAGSGGCSGESKAIKYRTSSNGIEWGSEQDTLVNGMDGVPWHINIMYDDISQIYWMFVSAITDGTSCINSMDLQLLFSYDLITWTGSSKKLLDKTISGFDNHQIYRASFIIGSETIKVWYSANNTSNEWNTGYSEIAYHNFIAQCGE